MVAKDFITNVTSVFPGAVARVVHPDPLDKTKVKYTMKGIAPRATPVDLRGRPYVRCQWRTSVALSTEDVDMTAIRRVPPPHKDCDVWFSPSNVEEMWSHIVEQHMEMPRDPDFPQSKFRDGLVRGTGKRFSCLWAGCNRYPEPGIEDGFRVAMHLKVHLPDFGPGAATRSKYTGTAGMDGSNNDKRPRTAENAKLEKFYLNTALDEKGQATGLPLAGMLVLRNIARQMLKIDEGILGARYEERETPKKGSKEPRRSMSLVERHFGKHAEKLFHVMTYNYSLRTFAPEFLWYVSKGLLDKEDVEARAAKRVKVDG
jgi:chromatin structure-remodeling complex subunit RSC9